MVYAQNESKTFYKLSCSIHVAPLFSHTTPPLSFLFVASVNLCRHSDLKLVRPSLPPRWITLRSHHPDNLTQLWSLVDLEHLRFVAQILTRQLQNFVHALFVPSVPICLFILVYWNKIRGKIYYKTEKK